MTNTNTSTMIPKSSSIIAPSLSSAPPIIMIVAALKSNYGIGNKGKLPWRLKQEIKYFKNVTSSIPSSSNFVNAVIMGRKTWESIPEKFRPLPNRLNIVLSRSYKNLKDDKNGIWYFNCFNKLLDDLSKNEYELNEEETNKKINKIFIIGGSEIYNKLIDDDRVNHLLITEVESNNDEKIEIDTWLNWDLKNSWNKTTKQDLKNFINDDSIELPTDKINEGDFTYDYTLWERKGK